MPLVITASVTTTVRRSTRALALVLGLAVGGCGEGTPTDANDPRDDSSSPFIVSNPSFAAGTAEASAAAVNASPLVFISLPPGRIPQGIRAGIRNLATGELVQTDVREGGFDPVPLHAVAGDQVSIEVTVAGNVEPVRSIEVVSLRRRPVVVRTDPPPRKRDVPLNKVISVVFSEPISASALTGGAILLRSGTTTIPAVLVFADTAQIVLNLTTSQPLVPETDYELMISTDIRDLAGDSLEEQLRVPFTTVAAVATRLAFDAPPVAALSGVPLSLIRVTVVDGAGRPVVGFQRPISLALSTNSEGAGLIGVTSANPTGGIASFMNLVVSHAGRGFTLVASAEGLSPTVSATFDVASGGRIAFASGRVFDTSRPSHIHVVNLDGGAVTQLTSGAVNDALPAWSPDGSRIAFTRWGDDATRGIYVMNADGSGLHRLTARGWSSAWSPDGMRIAFADSGLHLMNADGSGLVRLSDKWDDSPAWSPDGSTIAFHRVLDGVDDGLNQVFLMDADGSRQRRLTNNCSYSCGWRYAEGHPSWSPDGRSLTYWSFGFGVTIIAPDGTNAKSVSVPTGVYYGSKPDWSPDGRAIVFGAQEQLHLTRVDANAFTVLVSRPEGVNSPAWQRAR